MIKGAFGRRLAVNMRMQRERAHTVRSSKWLSKSSTPSRGRGEGRRASGREGCGEGSRGDGGDGGDDGGGGSGGGGGGGGVVSGVGTAVYANGDRYEGMWEDGLRRGQGTMTFMQDTSGANR